jgi:predicted metal-dependent hydrolase
LSSEETRAQFGHEAVRDLFVWHALEESEHKAVAFDVYKAVGGTERMRVTTMRILRYAFLIGTTIQMVVSLLMDPATYQRGRLRKSWKVFRSTPLASKDVWMQLKEYDRPDFHPDDRDTTALVEQWREVLFGEQGRLNDKLVSSAASAA